jgi:hypothetical protein
MAFYKVKASYHFANGVTYGKGDIIESQSPLMRRFPGKFMKVAGPDEDDNDDEPTSAKSSKSSKKTKKLKEKKKGKKLKTLKERVSSRAKIGKDITRKFQQARINSLRVYQNEDGKFNVATEKEPYEALNADPLPRTRLEKFISTQANPNDSATDE